MKHTGKFLGATGRLAAATAACVSLLALLGARPANALNARVRWSPLPDNRVVGYNVYVRQPHQTYGSPQRAGLPQRASDGSMAYQVAGLPAAPGYYFAVTAYTADGTETWLSNEVPIGFVNRCEIDRCYTPSVCNVTSEPDGTSCGTGPDPCANTCFAATCGVPTRVELDTRRLLLLPGRAGLRVTARGMFAPGEPVDPTGTGATLTLFDTGGQVLYRSALPGTAFQTNRSRKSFWVRFAKGATGLRRFSMSSAPTHVSVSIRGQDLDAALPSTDITWSLAFGTQCVRDLNLTCSVGASAVSCR